MNQPSLLGIQKTPSPALMKPTIKLNQNNGIFSTREPQFSLKNEQKQMQMNSNTIQRVSSQRVTNNNYNYIQDLPKNNINKNSFLALTNDIQDNENQYKIGNRQQQYNKQSYVSAAIEGTKEMNQNKKRSNMGEIGKLLMQNQDLNRFDRKPPQSTQIQSSFMNNVNRSRQDRSNSNNSKTNNLQQSFQEDAFGMRAAGLTVQEIEKLRDQKHNFAAEYNRKQLVVENERGGIFDRIENSGVKTMFIPNNQNNIQDEFQKNKQKHWQHVIKLGEDTPSQSIANQSSSTDLLQISNIENLPDDDKRSLINQRLLYLPPQTASLSSYEMCLKRRHGAKKLIGKRQQKLKAQLTMINEYY